MNLMRGKVGTVRERMTRAEVVSVMTQPTSPSKPTARLRSPRAGT